MAVVLRPNRGRAGCRERAKFAGLQTQQSFRRRARGEGILEHAGRPHAGGGTGFRGPSRETEEDRKQAEEGAPEKRPTDRGASREARESAGETATQEQTEGRTQREEAGDLSLEERTPRDERVG